MKWIIKDDTKGTILSCGNCGSYHIKHENVQVKKEDPFKKVTYDVKCSDCGARGYIQENW